MKPIILVHGGAGKQDRNKKEIQNAKDVLEKAANNGFKILKNSGSALNAVEKSINFLEDSAFFNAGKGADIQLDGKIRLDASIMTSSLDCGSVCSLEDIKYAISVARKIMEKTHHVMLSGIHATRFGKMMGFQKENLKTKEKIEVWRGLSKQVKGLNFKEKIKKLRKLDRERTVGCVAIDKRGFLAAGTSSGGRNPELAGRVGDTPLIGCGTYCNEFAAVSATGIGEAIIKSTLARRCCEYIEKGLSPQKAAEKAIKYLENITKSKAGMIVIDKNGRCGVCYNTKKMLWYKKF